MSQNKINLDDLDVYISQVITHLKKVQEALKDDQFPKPNYFYNFGGKFRGFGFGASILLTLNQEIVEEYQIFMDQFGRPLEGTFKSS